MTHRVTSKGQFLNLTSSHGHEVSSGHVAYQSNMSSQGQTIGILLKSLSPVEIRKKTKVCPQMNSYVCGGRDGREVKKGQGKEERN